MSSDEKCRSANNLAICTWQSVEELRNRIVNYFSSMTDRKVGKRDGLLFHEIKQIKYFVLQVDHKLVSCGTESQIRFNILLRFYVYVEFKRGSKFSCFRSGGAITTLFNVHVLILFIALEN